MNVAISRIFLKRFKDYLNFGAKIVSSGVCALSWRDRIQNYHNKNIVLRKSDSKIEIETEEVNETSANYEANLPNGLSSNIA